MNGFLLNFFAAQGPPDHFDILDTRCCCCGDAINRGDPAIALCGDERAVFLIPAFPFPDHNKSTSAAGTRLCRLTRCRLYDIGVAVHHECAAIFTQTCVLESREALLRLWILGTWRNPWYDASPVRLQPTYSVSRDAVERVAPMIACPQLSRCPTELLELIWRYDRHSLFWRTVTTMTLAASFSHPQMDTRPFLSTPLADIVAWERGGALSRLQDAAPLDVSSAPTTMLITRDAVGIKKVERLHTRPPPLSKNGTDKLAFTLVDVSKLDVIEAQLKDGLLRLIQPFRFWPLQIWDTPSPPIFPSESWALVQNKNEQPRRIRTIDLSTITGLTFIYRWDRLIGIHSHNEDSPSAMSFFEHLPPVRQAETVWIYVPISQADKIDVLGFRTCRGSSGGVDVAVILNGVLIRKRLSGDVVLGWKYFMGGIIEDRCTAKPTTLLYGEPPDTRYVTFLGAYRDPSPRAKKPSTYTYAHPIVDGPPPKDYFNIIPGIPDFAPQRHYFHHYSFAPLHKVTSAEVFYLPHRDHRRGDGLPVDLCRGIIFRYAHGGSRTVGQVRLHVDRSRVFRNPKKVVITKVFVKKRCWYPEIRFLPEPEGLPPSRAAGYPELPAGEMQRYDGPDGWRWTRSMKGMMHFWCDAFKAHVEIPLEDWDTSDKDASDEGEEPDEYEVSDA